MRGAMVFLATLCVGLGLVPGLLIPTLANLAGGAGDLKVHLGLQLPGTGNPSFLWIAVLLAAATVMLTALRNRPSTVIAPLWVCGQRNDPALRWTSAGFTKPLRLVLEAVLRPTREVTTQQRAGVIQGVSYRGEVPHLFDAWLYRPVLRFALSTASAIRRRIQSGSVRSYAAYLFGVMLILLALLRVGALS